MPILFAFIAKILMSLAINKKDSTKKKTLCIENLKSNSYADNELLCGFQGDVPSIQKQAGNLQLSNR